MNTDCFAVLICRKKVFLVLLLYSIFMFSVLYSFALSDAICLYLIAAPIRLFILTHLCTHTQGELWPDFYFSASLYSPSKIYFIGKVFVCCRLKWKCKWAPWGRTKWSYFHIYIVAQQKKTTDKKVKLDINQISLHYIDHFCIPEPAVDSNARREITWTAQGRGINNFISNKRCAIFIIQQPNNLYILLHSVICLRSYSISFVGPFSQAFVRYCSNHLILHYIWYCSLAAFFDLE